MKFTYGDRVVVRPPAAPGQWHTFIGTTYTNECKPGDVGTVDRDYNGARTYVHVRWDHGKTSNIDLACLDALVPEEALDAEARRLFGVDGSKPKKHCDTCTCTD